MPPGRPRKSKALKTLEGNRSREDLDYDEPTGDGVPRMPDDLDADAFICWESTFSQLVLNGAGSGDTLRIVGMCNWYSLYVRLQRVIAQSEVPDYKTVILAGLAWKNFESSASRFGLSPADRARLRTEPKPKPNSKWSGLLAS